MSNRENRKNRTYSNKCHSNQETEADAQLSYRKSSWLTSAANADSSSGQSHFLFSSSVPKWKQPWNQHARLLLHKKRKNYIISCSFAGSRPHKKVVSNQLKRWAYDDDLWAELTFAVSWVKISEESQRVQVITIIGECHFLSYLSSFAHCIHVQRALKINARGKQFSIMWHSSLFSVLWTNTTA